MSQDFNPILSTFQFSDIEVSYLINRSGQVGLRVIPISQDHCVTDNNVVLPEGITRDEAFGAMVVNFLRGLSTVKGLQVIDDILAREPRPKTLKERRAEANAENN